MRDIGKDFLEPAYGRLRKRLRKHSTHGKADLILDTGQVVYILEFNVVELLGDGEKAITQIKKQGYQQQYVQDGRKVILVGMDFSRKERNLSGFELEYV